MKSSIELGNRGLGSCWESADHSVLVAVKVRPEVFVILLNSDTFLDLSEVTCFSSGLSSVC